MTISGSTNKAICVHDPMATPIARSILSFHAAVTAVACSTALPTTGSSIRPTNVLLIAPVAVKALIESTYDDERKGLMTIELHMWLIGPRALDSP